MSFVTRYLEPAVVERLNHLQLSARRVVAGSTTGLHTSPVKGASVEFRQHRFYTPGDELRRLDWRVLGRTDRPYIKEYDEETNLRCLLLLDCSGSMAYGDGSANKFQYAAKLAASLAYLMLAQTEGVGLSVSAGGEGGIGGGWLAPHGGSAQLSRVIESLERSVPRGPSDLPRSMHDAADRLDRRALLILLSDLFTPLPAFRQGLAHWRHDHHEVIVIRILHRDELTFPFRSWSQFHGLEGEPVRLAEPVAVRQNYLENFHHHAREMRDGCRALGAEFATFVTDEPSIDSLTRFLHGRSARR